MPLFAYLFASRAGRRAGGVRPSVRPPSRPASLREPSTSRARQAESSRETTAGTQSCWPAAHYKHITFQLLLLLAALSIHLASSQPASLVGRKTRFAAAERRQRAQTQTHNGAPTGRLPLATAAMMLPPLLLMMIMMMILMMMMRLRPQPAKDELWVQLGVVVLPRDWPAGRPAATDLAGRPKGEQIETSSLACN